MPVVRSATAADAPALARLISAIWREHYVPIIGAAQVEYMLASRADPAAIAAEMAAGVGWLIASADGRLVGYASHARGDGPLLRPGDWKLRQLYVAAAQRGGGLGRRLLACVRDAAIAQGASTLMLTVNRRNALALAAYRRWGFRLRGDVCTPIGGGFAMDDHVLELPLEAA